MLICLNEMEFYGENYENFPYIFMEFLNLKGKHRDHSIKPHVANFSY
jgi:hypothetical protein